MILTVILTGLLAVPGLFAQGPRLLALAEAEALAVRNHPRIVAAKLAAEATKETVTQNRASLAPIVTGNLTAIGAEHSTTLGAGQLQTSSLYSRTAAGFGFSQNIFDFGRVRSANASAEAKIAAQNETANAVRAEILLEVRESYYRALLAKSQLRIAVETLDARRVTLKQIAALVNSNLRSTLDLSFAELNVSEAEVMVFRFENAAKASIAQLVAAIGSAAPESYELQDEPTPNPLGGDAEALAAQALRTRPELAAIRFNIEAARKAAEAERRNTMPTLAIVAGAGVYGPHDNRLRNHYSAAGVNLNIPLFNGNLFGSRAREAEVRAEVSNQELRDFEIRVTRDVRTAWIEATDAQKQLDGTAKVLDHAGRTLRLAQTRYGLGLSTIVELNQAQLSRVSAEVAAAAARYEYLLKRSLLAYHTGGGI